MEDFNLAALRRIGFSNHFVAQLHCAQAWQRPARITAVHRAALALHDGQSVLSTRAPEGEQLAVGDWVLLGPENRVASRFDPANRITRRSADGQRQVVAANVDTALLVMGLDHDFNPRRIERYVAVARAGDVTPLVVLTKVDAGTDVAARQAQLRARLPPSVDMVSLNALSGEACAALAPWLGEGQTVALLGSSGAGKSSLTNTLCGAGQDTGAVRSSDSRGRHTTSARSLHLCAGGACIIDTPGLRMLAADADADDIAASFDDIAALAAHCRFHDCRHAGEPGCAVAGQVDADRLANRNKLLREAQRIRQTPLDRIAERKRWQGLMREAGARARVKRG